jgi:hypothetical protein
VAIFFICCTLFVSCKKNNDLNGVDPAKLNREARSPEGGLVIQNNTPASIRVSINNVTREKLVAASTSDTIKGSPMTGANLLVETVVTDADGRPAGQQLVYVYALKFPAENEFSRKEINIPPTLFFVNVLNLSAVPATKLVVSAGGTGDMISYMAIGNSKKIIPCGYYPTRSLMADITVAAGDDHVQQWSFTGLVLPGVVNQSVAVTCQ